jgi:hypothetical protein
LYSYWQFTTPSFSVTPSPTPSSSAISDIFQKVEYSVVQITITKSNSNEIIILNGLPSTGRSTALGCGFVYETRFLLQ